jgi:hypothetical protein
VTLLSGESERSSLDQSTSVVGVDMDSERARKVREAAGSAARLARGSCVEYARRPGRTEVALRVRITRTVGPPMLHAVAAALISAARLRTGRAWGVLPGDKLVVVAAREAGALRREGMRAGREREADERESRGLVASHACKRVSLLGRPRKADPDLKALVLWKAAPAWPLWNSILLWKLFSKASRSWGRRRASGCTLAATACRWCRGARTCAARA